MTMTPPVARPWGTNIVSSQLTPGLTHAADAAARLLKAAQIVYGTTDAEMNARVIEPHHISWRVGAFTVMLNIENDHIFVAGSNWAADVDVEGNNLTLNGEVKGDDLDGTITIGVREFFSLVIAGAAIQHREFQLEW